MSRIVAISSTYGAGGSRVGPLAADLLGVAFHTRMLHADIAVGESEPDEPEHALRRLVDALARVPSVFGTTMPMPAEEISDDRRLQMVAEAEICRIAETTGGVILGRGAVVVLRGDPGVLRVRLDGPVERRIAQGARIEGIDEKAAARRRQATDRTRAFYVERAYGCDVADPSLYHLLVDSTAVSFHACAEAIAAAARDLWGRN